MPDRAAEVLRALQMKLRRRMPLHENQAGRQPPPSVSEQAYTVSRTLAFRKGFSRPLGMKLPETFHMVQQREKKDQGRNISRSRRRFQPNRTTATTRIAIPATTIGFLTIRLPIQRIMPKKVVAIVGDGRAGVGFTVT